MADHNENSPVYVRKNHQSMRVIVVTVGILIVSLSTAIEVDSAPVIIDEDSGGSWSDSFEDEEGLAELNNVSVQNGDITLASGQMFDPTNWTKQGLAIDIGSPGEYDSMYAQHTHVLKDGGLYKMWYAGWDGSNNRILYANSSDGITWDKQGLVLDIGSPGELDDTHVSQAPVLKDGSLYKIWYAGNDGSIDRVLYANSTDGITWSKQGLVLDLGSPGQLDDGSVRPYTVLNREFHQSIDWWSELLA